MRVFTLCVVAALLVVATSAAPAEDKITSLPGFNQAFPSPQYSGYLTVDQKNGRALHYWFVESENNPSTDPVVVWLNGGPGCSSLDGYFYEQGPLHFADPQVNDANGVPQLVVNPNRWNKIANMLFIEAPAGVGFSYSNTTSDYFTNDNKTAEDNWKAVGQFYQKFPEYTSNDLYLTGESYAGIYVPTLANEIRNKNAAGQSNFPLKGFLVGNGCIGNAVGACSPQGAAIRMEFLHGKGLFSQELYNQIKQHCPDLANPSLGCQQLLQEMGKQVGDVNIYNTIGPCVQGNGLRRPLEGGRMFSRAPVDAATHAMAKSGLGGPVECIDGITVGKYLNMPEVQKAIHVRQDLGHWTVCTNRIFYDSNIVSLLGLYPTLIKDYKVLIANGDADACVPYNGNEQWTSGLGLPVEKKWHQWMVNGQNAGYATNYAVNNFTFITVRGSGHMIPQFRPESAYEMFRRFVGNVPF